MNKLTFKSVVTYALSRQHLSESIFHGFTAGFVMTIARNFLAFAENITLVLVLAVAFSLAADLVWSANRVAIWVAFAGEVVLVVARFALALAEETSLIAAAFFLAALALVAGSEERVHTAVADVASIGVDADSIDITVVSFIQTLINVLAFQGVRVFNSVVAGFANALAINVSLFFWADLFAIFSVAFVAFFAEAVKASFGISADCIFMTVVKLVTTLVCIATSFARSVVSCFTFALEGDSVGRRILINTFGVFTAHIFLLAFVDISTGNLPIRQLNWC